MTNDTESSLSVKVCKSKCFHCKVGSDYRHMLIAAGFFLFFSIPALSRDLETFETGQKEKQRSLKVCEIWSETF